MEIEKIRNYISYFETIHAETACRWEGSQKLKNGAFSMPFPVYETQFLNFIDDVSNSDLMDVNYGGVLEEYGLEMNDELTKKIDTAVINTVIPDIAKTEIIPLGIKYQHK